MADLSGLKRRVELIDLRLKTAHSARERESAALMEIWEQIRERFLDQNAEIARLHDRISGLEDARDELLQMVHGLLAAVESGLEQMSDETVPQIKVLANKLLNEHDQVPVAHPAADDPMADAPDNSFYVDASQGPSDGCMKEANFHDDLLSVIEQSLNETDENMPREDGEEADYTESSRRQTVGKPASPGIRDLIARIESAVGPELVDKSQPSSDEEELDDELTRDLREIEALRGELHGLRERIAGAGR